MWFFLLLFNSFSVESRIYDQITQIPLYPIPVLHLPHFTLGMSHIPYRSSSYCLQGLDDKVCEFMPCLKIVTLLTFCFLEYYGGDFLYYYLIV